MDRESILRESLRRASDLRKWYLGALLHFEDRKAHAVERAVAHIERTWDADDAQWSSIAHHVWEEIEAALSAIALKEEVLEEGRTCAAGHLGQAEPPWELWEVPLVVGLLLVKTAEIGFKSESWERHIQSGLLLSDATQAQHAWTMNRGLARCRRPDEKSVRMDQALDQALMSLGRQDLGRKNAMKRAALYASPREWIRSEWAEHRDAYNGNKSAFARHYSRRLMMEKGVDVKEKTIKDVWLRDTPFTGKTVLLPAAG